MPSQKLIVNEQDLSLLGLWVESPQGWGGGPARTDTLVEVTGAGQVLLPEAERVGPRRWSVSGTLIATTQAAALTAWDAAKQIMQDTILEVTILPWSDRLCVCRLVDARWDSGRLEDKGFRFTLTFLAASAYMVAPLVDTYSVTAAGETILTLGTAPSPFIVQFMGPCSSPTLTYYDANGIPQGAVQLAGDLLSREWLHFDSQTLQMIRYSTISGQVDGADYLNSGSRLFQLDPNDGVPSRGPSLALDVGSALIYTRKAYL